jgi:aminoglycoside phosphotransferase family enzyme/predicted kinase
MDEASQADIVEFLQRGCERHIATHAAHVFLTRDRALKLKRAVKYPYLDFSTPELRRQACEAELALNRRTAPALYLAVKAVTRARDGALALGGDGAAVDWVLEMRRFPDDALFTRLAESGGLTSDLMRRLADNIVRFHRAADATPNFGGTAGIDYVISVNSESLRRDGPPTIGVAEAAALTEAARAARDRHADLLERRRKSGKVKRCHGDLHLGNICLLDGEPTLFDCLEFNEALASIDVLYDLAFLLMDLRFRDHPTEAVLVLNRYLDVSDESDGLALMPLFLALRAWVRAHVAATAARRDRSAENETLARRYFDFALDLLRPAAPRLVAIGGFSGTGKSTVAAILAGRIAARVLRSDVIRKRQAGAAPETRLSGSAYSPEMTARVYAALIDQARVALAAGSSVIIDAVSAVPEERRSFAALAAELGVPFTGIWLEAAPEVLSARIAARRNDASDADTAVLRKQLAYDLGKMDWRRVDAAPSAEHVADVILDAGIGR